MPIEDNVKNINIKFAKFQTNISLLVLKEKELSLELAKINSEKMKLIESAIEEGLPISSLPQQLQPQQPSQQLRPKFNKGE